MVQNNNIKCGMYKDEETDKYYLHYVNSIFLTKYFTAQL